MGASTGNTMIQTITQTESTTLNKQQPMPAKFKTSRTVGGMSSTVKSYLSLHRWNYHQNFAVVCIGALLYDGPAIGAAKLTADLLKLYFSFNVCLTAPCMSLTPSPIAKRTQHTQRRG